jgi:hypothetical protein
MAKHDPRKSGHQFSDKFMLKQKLEQDDDFTLR